MTNPAVQVCPLCDQALPSPSQRYPRAICATCTDLVTDERGRGVSFFNTHFSGGLAATYRDSEKPWPFEHAYVRGILCAVCEHRFGGVVYQPSAETVPPFRVVQGDLTALDVDALVNAANESLLGGGGVDGAIHRAAGPGLLAECRTLGGCAVGEAKLTRGYNLRARYVIHTVGPRWRGGTGGEAAELAACYRHSLELAAASDVHSLAFPAISTGAFGYPLGAATRIAVDTVLATLPTLPRVRRVLFCAFDEATTQALVTELAGRQPPPAGERRSDNV